VAGLEGAFTLNEGLLDVVQDEGVLEAGELALHAAQIALAVAGRLLPGHLPQLDKSVVVRGVQVLQSPVGTTQVRVDLSTNGGRCVCKWWWGYV